MVDGKILTAHCDCMAGLGETCSHVSSLLWVIAVGTEKRDSLTVTQKTAYWVMPPAVRSVTYAPIKNINFTGKKKKAATNVKDDSSKSTKRRKLDNPTAEEKAQFLDALASCENAKPTVLAIMPEYCEKYVPTTISSDLPPVLANLYDPSNLGLSYYELLKLSSETRVTITSEQCKAVELRTRDQDKSKLWFRMRAGRITASKFKSVCHTDPASPSLSLIMSICHPDTMRFKTAATSWGCVHETSALEQYKKASGHDQLRVFPAGLFISVEHPYVGASPDAMVCCSCCGSGICEVKVSEV